MFENIDTSSLAGMLGGATGVIVMFGAGFMKIKRMFSTEKLSTIKDSTESTLITSMMADIDRVRQELKEVKDEHRVDMESIREAHRKDREDFISEIAGLKREIGVLKRKNESMRAEALEAYAFVSNSTVLADSDCVIELKDKLMRIAVEDIPSRVA